MTESVFALILITSGALHLASGSSHMASGQPAELWEGGGLPEGNSRAGRTRVSRTRREEQKGLGSESSVYIADYESTIHYSIE